MKNLWWIGLAEAAMWISVGAAIIVALYWTQRVSVLWFFLIPALGGHSIKHKEEGGEDE